MPKRLSSLLHSALTTICVLAFILFVSAGDSLPMWMLISAVVVAWAALLVLTINDLTKPITLYMNVDGKWVPMDKMTLEDIEKELEEDNGPVRHRK